MTTFLRGCCVLSICSLVLGVVIGRALGDEAALKRRVLEEWPRAIAELEAHLADLSGSGRFLDRGNLGTPGEFSRSGVFTFARSGGRARLIRKQDPSALKGPESAAHDPATAVTVKRGASAGSARETVACFNKRYAFLLSRAAPSEPYAVRSFGNDISEARTVIDRFLGKGVDSAWHAGGVTLKDILSLPGHSLDRVSEQPSEDGKGLLRIDFSVHRASGRASVRGLYLMSGWFLVSPENHWALKRFELLFALPDAAPGSGSRNVGDIEYGGEDAGFPLPRKVTLRTYGFAGPEVKGAKETSAHATAELVKEEVYEFEGLRLGAVPPDEFTTAAFGLPDLTEGRNRSRATQPVFWIFVLGLLLLSVSVALRYYAKRHQRRA